MAADQRNLEYFQYTDDDARTWTVRQSNDSACAGVNPSRVTFSAADPVLARQTRRNHARKVVFQDPTTLRTKTCIINTPADYAAVTGATTIAVHVEGETGTVTYSNPTKVPERLQAGKAGRHDADHA